MGNSNSVSLPPTIYLNHKYTSSTSLLPSDHEGGVADTLLHIEIPQHIFTTDSERFPVSPFHNICIQGNKSSVRHQIVLEDTITNAPIAVCKLMFTGLVPYKIYTTKPNYPGQKKSSRKYNESIPLFTYAEVRVGHHTKEIVLILKTSNSNEHSSDDDRYIVETVGPFCHVVMRSGQTVALMQLRSWNETANTVLLTVSPGIDPCLMICLASICDHLEEIEVRE